MLPKPLNLIFLAGKRMAFGLSLPLFFIIYILAIFYSKYALIQIIWDGPEAEQTKVPTRFAGSIGHVLHVSEAPHYCFALRGVRARKCFHKVSKGAKIRNRYNQVPHLTKRNQTGKPRWARQTAPKLTFHIYFKETQTTVSFMKKKILCVWGKGGLASLLPSTLPL